MDKIFSLGQLVISIIMLACVVVYGVAHTIMGNIKGFGFLVLGVFLYLMWTLVRLSWVEYQQEKNK